MRTIPAAGLLLQSHIPGVLVCSGPFSGDCNMVMEVALS